jgi:hypothetical protein
MQISPFPPNSRNAMYTQAAEAFRQATSFDEAKVPADSRTCPTGSPRHARDLCNQFGSLGRARRYHEYIQCRTASSRGARAFVIGTGALLSGPSQSSQSSSLRSRLFNRRELGRNKVLSARLRRAQTMYLLYVTVYTAPKRATSPKRQDRKRAAVSTIMPARSCRRDVAGRKQHPVAKVAHSTWNPALPSSSARESLAFKLSGPKRAGGRGESKDSRSARGVFARMSRQYLRLGRSVNRQVDAVEALQAPVAGDKCRQKRAREMRQAGSPQSEIERVRTVCDLGSAPRSPPVAFSIVNRRGPSLPCKSRKPFTGRREEPVTNCSRRDLVSTGQDLTVCARIKTGR